MRVLLIDDNPQIRTIIQRIIEALGHSIAVAENGHGGMTVAASGTFDVILIDLELPDMTGFVVAGALRAAGSTARLVALSAHPLDRVAEERAAAGFSASLTKPVDIAALAQLLT